jgi:hypothetical protein
MSTDDSIVCSSKMAFLGEIVKVGKVIARSYQVMAFNESTEEYPYFISLLLHMNSP